MTNISGSDINGLEYTVLSIDTPSGWDVGICNNNYCITPSVRETYYFNPVTKDSTHNIKVAFWPNNIAGCGNVKIYVYDSNDPSSGDTLTFEYCCSFPSDIKELSAKN